MTDTAAINSSTRTTDSVGSAAGDKTAGSSAFGEIRHHGAVDGVTGSCHQLFLNENSSILVDCGLFQGAETSSVAFTVPPLYGPTSSEGCDELVIESAYGDCMREGHEQRAEKLCEAIERGSKDGGSVLIPSFTIGRPPGAHTREFDNRHGGVKVDVRRYIIKSGIEVIDGCSAHVNQQELMAFARIMSESEVLLTMTFRPKMCSRKHAPYFGQERTAADHGQVMIQIFTSLMYKLFFRGLFRCGLGGTIGGRRACFTIRGAQENIWQ